MRKAMGAVAAVVTLAGCSAGKDIPLAEAGVADFHRGVNAAQFDTIYEGASDDMKRVTTQAQLVQLLSAVHRKLGMFQSGKSVGWNDNVTTSGHFLTLNYESNYSGGRANETFVYRIAADKASLTGYNINSTALIVN